MMHPFQVIKQFMKVLIYFSRESRYPRLFLRRKNATSRTDGEREQASIRKARGSLVDPFT
jgi:hypothetical protein